jgi:dienelactone hydrolase
VTAVERFMEFNSGSNMLRGMIHLPRARKRMPGVLLLHGFTGQTTGAHFILIKCARALAGRGVAAMRFDFAGSGESEGLFQDMSVLTEFEDARAALSRLARVRGVDRTRLGVPGLSLGGCVAAMLLADTRLGAGVLWAPVADLMPLAEMAAPPLARRQLASKGYVEFGAHKVGTRFVDDAARADPVSGIRRSVADVLVVHGSKDEAVPLEHGRAIARSAAERTDGSRTEFTVIEGADHTLERVRHEDEVIRRSVEWFVESLGTRRTGADPQRRRGRRGRGRT